MPLTKDKIESRIRQMLSEQLGVDEAECTHNASLVDDLAADSLDMVELTMSCEEAFEIEIPDEDAEQVKTVGQMVAYIERRTT